MCDIREVVADGREGQVIVLFSDTLPLGEKRSCTKFAGTPHEMRHPAHEVQAFFNGLKITLSPATAYISPPDVAGLSGELCDGRLLHKRKV